MQFTERKDSSFQHSSIFEAYAHGTFHGSGESASEPAGVHRDESEVIQDIVMDVRHILDRRDPFATKNLLGVSSQAQDVITELEKRRSKDVVSIAIWGMGGVGKTTLAKVIFHHIQYEFEITCFLSNVGETWMREGKVYLQKKLHSIICEEIDIGILDSIESASRNMEVRLCHKKLLLVLDDVEDLEQLEALCGNHKWFGQGSGLTLNLKVLGSLLYGRSPIEWESALNSMGGYTHFENTDISNALKFSFDSLDDNEKEIFLNVVLFSIGEDMDDVIQKLDDFGCHASIGMRVLVDKSLVTIDNNNKIRMCDALQRMGRRMLCETSKKELQNQGMKSF
ncbi:hypothetical protein K1719_022909 [Acacia pycnantha]|nr:hypothetical protein K1719_022909 [Acacia pycnantha]